MKGFRELRLLCLCDCVEFSSEGVHNAGARATSSNYRERSYVVMWCGESWKRASVNLKTIHTSRSARHILIGFAADSLGGIDLASWKIHCNFAFHCNFAILLLGKQILLLGRYIVILLSQTQRVCCVVRYLT